MQPFIVYWHKGTPNPAKVLIILEELGLPYQTRSIDSLGELKQPAYESVNPNGRLPALIDPNANITLWESNAIVFYLVSEYNKDNKITYTSSPEKYQLQQWSYFQASGQGPYFGQAAWFNFFHPEPVTSAKERYANEAKRVVGVLNNVLKGRDWLVGDKLTWVDLTFFPWNNAIKGMLEKGPVAFNEDEYPDYKRWMDKMRGRDSVMKVVKEMHGDGPSSDGKQ